MYTYFNVQKNSTSKSCVSEVTFMLNTISYALHILLMTAEVNESQFPKFCFQFYSALVTQ